MNKNFIADLNNRIKKNLINFIIIFIISVVGALVIRFHDLAKFKATIEPTSIQLLILFVSIICTVYLIYKIYIGGNRDKRPWHLHRELRNFEFNFEEAERGIELYKLVKQYKEEGHKEPDILDMFGSKLFYSLSKYLALQPGWDMINKIDSLLKTNYPKLPDEISKKYAYRIYELLRH